MTSMHSARWTKLGATTSHASARKMMSAWINAGRGSYLFFTLCHIGQEKNSGVYFVPAPVRSAPESGQIADVSVSPVYANRVISQRGQQHRIRSPRRRVEQRATWNGSPASRWNGTRERWSDANRGSARFHGRCRK